MAVLDSEMNRMQQDAIRRMREMQTRAIPQQPGNQQDTRTRGDRTQPRQSATAAHSPNAAQHSAVRNEPRAPNRHPEPAPRQTAPHPPQGTVHSSRSEPAHTESHRTQRAPEPVRQEPTPQAEPEKPANPLTGFFEMLFKDSDRTLILALLLILYEEKADPSLLFALMYI
ncbi:hypothetical protein POG20_18960, partial [Blautia wexlerae]|nr:hypothetical protein [Blautia wexlerae]